MLTRLTNNERGGLGKYWHWLTKGEGGSGPPYLWLTQFVNSSLLPGQKYTCDWDVTKNHFCFCCLTYGWPDYWYPIKTFSRYLKNYYANYSLHQQFPPFPCVNLFYDIHVSANFILLFYFTLQALVPCSGKGWCEWGACEAMGQNFMEHILCVRCGLNVIILLGAPQPTSEIRASQPFTRYQILTKWMH